MVIFKIYQLNKTDFDLDILGKQLKAIKSYIKPNCTIGFYDNTSDPTLLVELQYEVAPTCYQQQLNPRHFAIDTI